VFNSLFYIDFLIKEEKNSAVFLRPKFFLEIDKNEKDTLGLIKKNLLDSKERFRSKSIDFHVFIDISEKKSHFWSPQLHIEVLPKDKNSCTVKGLFGPKPQVWTFFMFLHFAVGICFLVFATMLYVNYSLDKSLLFPLLMVIILPILWVILYFIGRLGRDFGKKQMIELHDFLLSSIS